MPRRIWLLIREPRVITALTGLMWLIVTGIGLAALVAPPLTIAHKIGPWLTVYWGGALLLGGVLGLVGALPGWWWVERSGIAATATGIGIYLAVLIMLQAQAGSGSSWLVQIGFVLLALIALVVRWMRIRGAQIDPLRGMERDH